MQNRPRHHANILQLRDDVRSFICEMFQEFLIDEVGLRQIFSYQLDQNQQEREEIIIDRMRAISKIASRN
jgi:hypothetical protein